ncbi:uncharacterized protein LOC143546624 [Bidens hawaiensis]|uniref:uncharacterized protein LOC143546624 n=1 Tax=Bidens hawaiensis TaxID=980011 RepID=UPI004049D631
MSSQLNFHSIKTPSDFTFCDIQNTKYHQEHHEIPTPLWSKNLPSNSTGSSYPTQTTVEERKELTEMIKGLPESWHELSLKDMVADQDPYDFGLSLEYTVDMKPKLKGKKKVVKKGPISRSVSLDTGVFLLKMFVPSSFGSKKHTVSRSTSMNGLKKRDIDVKQLKSRFFDENKSNISSRSYEDNMRANNNSYEEGRLKSGCGFEPTNQKWCVFF